MVRKNDGYLLIQVMVLVGIVSLVAAGMAALMYSKYHATGTFRAQSQKIGLTSVISSYAGDPSVIRTTAAFVGGNFGLCVNGGGVCVGNVMFPVPLYLPTPAAGFLEVSGAGAPVPLPVGGAPVYYALDGSICAAGPSIQCPLAVFTYYTAKCPPPGPNCAQAASISMIYYIAQALTITGQTAMKTVCNDPAQPASIYNGENINIQIPLPGTQVPSNILNGNFAGFWSSSTQLGVSSLLVNNSGNSVVCNAATAGMIRSNGGRLEICGDKSAVFNWRWMGGANSGTTADLPVLNGYYLCPVSLTPVLACSTVSLPPCAGQLQGVTSAPSTSQCLNGSATPCSNISPCIKAF